MPRKTTATKLVRLQAKGQLTLPAQFRRRLQLEADTIVQVALQGEGLVLTPLRQAAAEPPLREFSQADIARFRREDRLDRATADKVQRLLGKRHAA
jgi:bifunctional DNA-binding transcriptional regulator/antitoxin component of YhaV-PrlF toxin-antitoxin module